MRNYILFILLIHSFFSYCQNSSPKAIELLYSPDGNKNGLKPVYVKFKYQFIYAVGDIYLVKASECSSNLLYQYKGRDYTFTDLAGSDAVRKIEVTTPTVEMSIYGPNGFIKKVRPMINSTRLGGVLSADADVVCNAKSNAEKNTGNYYISDIKVVSVYYENTTELNIIIEKKLREEKIASDIEKLISGAQNDQQYNNPLLAKQKFEKALLLDKNNQRALSGLESINKKLKEKDKKNLFDDLIKRGNDAQNKGDLDQASKLYNEALENGSNNGLAQNYKSSIDYKKDQKQRELAKKAEDLKKESDRAQQENDKEQKDILERIKKKEEFERNTEKDFIKKQMDSISKDLDQKERIEADAKMKKYWDDKRIEEKRVEKEEDEKTKQERNLRRDSDNVRIQNLSSLMKEDREEFIRSTRIASEKHDEAIAYNVKIREAGELKKEWWDNNSYIQVIADDLYENQRESNHQNVMILMMEQKNLYELAKELYFDALLYVNLDSQNYKYTLSMIEYINKEIDFSKMLSKVSPKGEKIRKENRAFVKSMVRANRMDNNKTKAEMAFSIMRLQDPYSIENNFKAIELTYRLNAADDKYRSEAAVAGQTHSVANDLIYNNEGTVVGGRKFAVINALTKLEYLMTPILMNITSDNEPPRTEIDDFITINPIFGIEVMWMQTKFFDLRTDFFGGIGITPNFGESIGYIKYGGKLNLDFGLKRFKIATLAAYEFHNAEREIDYEVNAINNGYEIITPSNKQGVGSFNYSLLKLGAGIKIDISDEDESGHIMLMAIAEKPSFYKEDFTKKPIVSFFFEVQFLNGISIGAGYAKNYFIAGEKKYAFGEIKNKDFYSFSIGKKWTILDPSAP
jgi:hypothetical protein